MSTTLLDEIKKRRTFGIISHPDAGKTTLTEKLLLFGGAINVAGAVKAKKATRHATSDFMEIEKQRGISVATSVMGFYYKDFKINLLDTPGHKDFCEDTYRTLTAVDSAVMVIDAVKGVESQTFKLLEVCRMRETPIITFINKLDRECRDPIELMDEIESKLSMTICPMSWPIGTGKSFKGVYSLIEKRVILFKAHGKQETGTSIEISDINSSALDDLVGNSLADQLREDLEMVQGVYPAFDEELYLGGEITPVFFGSALNNFGVRELLDCFVDIAPPPKSRETEEGTIEPFHDKFSGFVFKIHANIDPRHRDRIAFVRICSGEFERNKTFFNVRSQKRFKAHNPTAFMASDKEIIETAYPGDIIGLHDTGNFKIGDSLTDSEELHFKGIPSFSPELFKSVANLDPLKTKQLYKGLEQLCEEGVAQLFKKTDGNQLIVGTVGDLQFEVIKYRLENEYKANCRFDTLPFFQACWITSDDDKALQEFIRLNRSNVVYDVAQSPVYLAETKWALDREINENKTLDFHFTSEF